MTQTARPACRKDGLTGALRPNHAWLLAPTALSPSFLHGRGHGRASAKPARPRSRVGHGRASAKPAA
jgi:hypothetical protein